MPMCPRRTEGSQGSLDDGPCFLWGLRLPGYSCVLSSHTSVHAGHQAQGPPLTTRGKQGAGGSQPGLLGVLGRVMPSVRAWLQAGWVCRRPEVLQDWRSACIPQQQAKGQKLSWPPRCLTSWPFPTPLTACTALWRRSLWWVQEAGGPALGSGSSRRGSWEGRWQLGLGAAACRRLVSPSRRGTHRSRLLSVLPPVPS